MHAVRRAPLHDIEVEDPPPPPISVASYLFTATAAQAEQRRDLDPPSLGFGLFMWLDVRAEALEQIATLVHCPEANGEAP